MSSHEGRIPIALYLVLQSIVLNFLSKQTSTWIIACSLLSWNEQFLTCISKHNPLLHQQFIKFECLKTLLLTDRKHSNLKLVLELKNFWDSSPISNLTSCTITYFGKYALHIYFRLGETLNCFSHICKLSNRVSGQSYYR